ncbi:hypothetical protein EMPS_04773 [Entomortierella parvispora]|uniref:Uncharacterized protein n=1 Tax=Entomortierella parvispora TaxID=205924 RepID=A0A9P3LVQ1_9FUNG|nr:hypothetical protein EMPS_04773 [Entomortierella parvispora]
MLSDDNKASGPPPIEDKHKDESEEDDEDDTDFYQGGDKDKDEDDEEKEEENAPFRDNHNKNKVEDNGKDDCGRDDDGIQNKKSLVLLPPKTVTARRVRFALDSEGRPEMESHPIHAPAPAGSRSRPTSFPTSIIRRRAQGTDVPLDSNPTPGSQTIDSEDEDTWQTPWERGTGQRMLPWCQGTTTALTAATYPSSSPSSSPTPSKSTRRPLDDVLFQMLDHHTTTEAAQHRTAPTPPQDGDPKSHWSFSSTGHNGGHGDRTGRGHGCSHSSPLSNRRGLQEIDRWFMEPSTAAIIAEETLSGGRDHRGRIGEEGSRPPIVRPLVHHERESHAIHVPNTSYGSTTTMTTTDTNIRPGTQASATHQRQRQGWPGAGGGHSFVKGHRRSAPLFTPTEQTPSPIAAAPSPSWAYTEAADLDSDLSDVDSLPVDDKERQDRPETMKDHEYQMDSEGDLLEEEVFLDYFYFRQLAESHGGSSADGSSSSSSSSSHGPLDAICPPAPPPFLPVPDDLVPAFIIHPTVNFALPGTDTDDNGPRNDNGRKEKADKKKKKFFKNARSRFSKGFRALSKVFRPPFAPKFTLSAVSTPSPSSSSASTQPSSSSSSDSTSPGGSHPSPHSTRRHRTRTDSSSSRREARRLLADTSLSSRREESINSSSKDQQEEGTPSAMPPLQLITDIRVPSGRHSLGSNGRPLSATPIADAHARHVFIDRPLPLRPPETHRTLPPLPNEAVTPSNAIISSPPVSREHVRTPSRSATSSFRGDWFQRWRSSLNPSKRHSAA